MNVDPKLIESIYESAPAPNHALLLFGSRARDDHQPNSDVDVLAIVSSPQSFSAGTIRYSCYTLQSLMKMASTGDLFILHLIKDAITIAGDEHILSNLKKAFIRPASYVEFRHELVEIAKLLDPKTLSEEIPVARKLRLAKYLLRSYVYSLLADDGRVTFSMKEAGEQLNDPRIHDVFTDSSGDDRALLNGVATLFESLSGSKIKNDHGSTEALVLNLGKRFPRLESLGVRLCSGTASDYIYSLQTTSNL